MCDKNKKHQTFLSVLLTDKPQSAIIFVSEQVRVDCLKSEINKYNIQTAIVTTQACR